jgi:membrane associated rhomboid family serine protease
MSKMPNEKFNYRQLILFPSLLVLMIWIVELVEQFGGYRFTRYGIFPRDPETLLGIITAPFIHSDWGHLISNSFPLFVLSMIMVAFYKRLIIPVYFGLILMVGISVWLFARESYHIGISGIVYGLIGFIFWSGLFRDNTKSIILSLIILIAYSGYFHGLTPEEGVSWESHLFGALAGAFFAFFYKNIEAGSMIKEEENLPKIQQNLVPFFDENTFQITKENRAIQKLLDED